MFSQNKEEEIILNYFGDFVGTFLDLGAFDGVNLSNTRALVEKGWNGVLIEASPTVFKLLEKNCVPYPHLELHNIAISGSINGDIEFFDNHNAVATMHEGELKRWGSTETFNKITVPCREVRGFIGARQFDFISCDIEGEDMRVLKKLDMTDTKMVCVEWNGKGRAMYDMIMRVWGMKCLHVNAENLIYGK